MTSLRNSSLLPHYAATLKLGVPIAIGQLGVIILGFADTMMVGRYSTDALASASFVNNLFTLITFFFMGYSYGLTPVISAHYGRGEKAEAGGALKSALMANSLFAALILGIMTILYFYVDRMGQPSHLLPLIRPYYLVILSSMFFVMLYNVIRQFTDGTTDTMSGMVALLAGNVLNIVGNWLLIYGVGPFPEMGLLGAGISTLFSRIFMVVFLVAIIYYRNRYKPYIEGFHKIPLKKEAVKAINKCSLPISMQMGMESGSFTCSAIMAGWIGAIELASYQVMVTIGTLGFLFYYSFGAGASIRVATFVGTNNWKQVKLCAKAGFHILAVMAVLSSLTIYTFAEQLIGIFSNDPAVIATALGLIGVLILYQIADATQICYANVLRGTGTVMPIMWIAFVSYIMVNIPCTYLLGFPLGLGIHGIFLALSCGLFTAAPLFYWQYRRVLKRHNSQ